MSKRFMHRWLFLALIAQNYAGNDSREVQGALLHGKQLAVSLITQENFGDPVFIRTQEVTVGPGIELEDFYYNQANLTIPSIRVDIDISDTKTLIRLLEDQPPSFTNALRFRDNTLTIDTFRGARIKPETTWQGFTSTFLLVSQEEITVSFGNSSGLAGQVLCFEVIPEPAGATLAGAAAVAGVAIRRRRVQRDRIGRM